MPRSPNSLRELFMREFGERGMVNQCDDVCMMERNDETNWRFCRCLQLTFGVWECDDEYFVPEHGSVSDRSIR